MESVSPKPEKYAIPMPKLVPVSFPERPKRKRDRAGKQQALMMAAARLFAERGFEATTTREIAAAASCAEGLIHRYFGGKDGLFRALIEKRNLASLRFTKQASASAQQLLAVCHDCYDALLATGFSKYIIGSMAAPVRWMLRLGGLPADKQGGIADLQMTADHGHYLAPFARILLAIAYVREKDRARALELLSGLEKEFPGNTLFPHEIARLRAAH